MVPVADVAVTLIWLAVTFKHTSCAAVVCELITGSGFTINVATFDAVVLQEEAPPVAPFLTST